MPYFWLTAAGSTATVFDIQKNSSSIYSVTPNIASSAYTSTSTPGTLIGGINTFAQGDLIQFKVTTSGTGAVGAKALLFIS
jgi:hypothetical protein